MTLTTVEWVYIIYQKRDHHTGSCMHIRALCKFILVFKFVVFRSSAEYFTHMHPYIDLCSLLIAIDQRRFFSVQNLPRHGTSNLQRLVTFISIVKVFYRYWSRRESKHRTFRVRGERSNRLNIKKIIWS